VQDLLNICLARSYDGDDVEVSCGGNNVFVCEYALKALNKSLHNVFNGSDALIANIPFFLEIELEANTESILTSTNITNFGSVISKYKRKNVIVNATNYRVFGFKKASSDLFVWATAQREIKVLLALYFK
ncbi:MAG: hypothetical protein HRU03_04265, partial [Nanoarchaeales archaeon]|nr:hypothetical protein [Nanoarchaeales archaeon]